MKVLYLDCFAGVSGDMLLGALLDLGVTMESLTERLSALGMHGYRLVSEKTAKGGITATKVTVELTEVSSVYKHLPDILEIISHSKLPTRVKDTSCRTFAALAAAEGKIHGLPPERVHFHEVGAVDAIVDIVGSISALEVLGVDRVICSRLPLGSGFIQCAHGTLPLPAPAVLELLQTVPTVSCDITGETVTPTGAALVKTLSSGFGPMPAMKISSVGYGAGQADREIPNVLRAVLGVDTLGENAPCQPSFPDVSGCGNFLEDYLTVIETNIDNMNPEFYEHIMSLLLGAGAVDVWLTPVIMKKNRPGQILACLVPQQNQGTLTNILLRETSSLGVRHYPCHRYKLDRMHISVSTDYGLISVKVGLFPGSGAVLNIAPEWEDCKAAALQHNVPVKVIYDLAKAEAYKALKKPQQ